MAGIDEVLKFVETSEKLLQLERNEEISQTSVLQESSNKKELERQGVCLLKLRIVSSCTGLYGRTVFTFERFQPGADDNSLPSHKLSPGDIVGLYPAGALGGPGPTQIASGLVNKTRAKTISVAFDENVEEIDQDHRRSYNLLKLANDITYKRLKRVLEELRAYQRSGPAYRLIEVLFNITAPRVTEAHGHDQIEFINRSLNESQKSAVAFALAQPEISVIHGPPGTGKTTTVAEVILQAVKRGEKVLVCAPANVAVDNLVEKLTSVKAVRLGHPARVFEGNQKFSLDAQLSRSDNSEIIIDVRRDIEKITSKIKKTKNKSQRHAMYSECKELRKELSRREKSSVEQILKSSDVVLATLTSCSSDGPVRHLPPGHFDFVVIDECSQAIEPACWIGLLNAPRCVLAGDYKQLPPTILSKQAAVDGLSVSLMERVIAEHGDLVVRMLNTQYRMNNVIMQWPSKQLYNNSLIADHSVRNHLLSDLDNVVNTDETSMPLLLIDTAGCNMYELPSDEKSSKGNQYEADIVTQHVRALIASNVPAHHIAIITPYNQQVEMLRQSLQSEYPQLEVKSVDGFQGREKEAIIITMVRSNPQGEIGFLADNRRINVALTRARRHLALVGDTETLNNDDFLKSLFEYIYENGAVYNAMSYTDYTVKDSGTASARIYNQNTPSASQSKRNKKLKSDRQSKAKTVDASSRIEINDDEQYLVEEIESFLGGIDRTNLFFPESLSSRQRKIVHQTAEDRGLYHRSHGDGAARRIVISKKPNPDQFEEISLEPLKNTGGQSIDDLSQTSDDGSMTRNEASGGIVSMLEQSIPCGVNQITEKSTVVFPSNSANNTRGNIDPPTSPRTVDSARKADASSCKVDASQASTDNPKICSISEYSKNERRIKANHRHENNESSDKSNIGPRPAETDASRSACEVCSKLIPRCNMDLHLLHCRWMEARSARSAGGENPPLKTQSAGGRRAKGPVVKPKPVATAAVTKKGERGKKCKSALPNNELFETLDPDGNLDDFDSMMELLAVTNKTCGFSKCKTSVVLVGENCGFCRQRYCLKHFVPEVHGCGEEARVAARRRLKLDGVVYPGSGTVDKKPNATKKAQLKIQLDKKLSDLTDQRQKKKKDRTGTN